MITFYYEFISNIFIFPSYEDVKSVYYIFGIDLIDLTKSSCTSPIDLTI